MFYYLEGELTHSDISFCVLDVNGVGYKVFSSDASLTSTQGSTDKVKFYTHLNVKEDALDIYGFVSLFELEVFKKLIGISGVGPKSGLAVLNVADLKELVAAINEGKAELLTRVSGIGRKTAERVVLELKDKIEAPRSAETVKQMEANIDMEEALISLGYGRKEAREAVSKVESTTAKFEDRLKEALKNISGK